MIAPDSFFDHLQAQAVHDRIPLSGTIELTYRCNLNCIHCYCNRPPAHHPAGRELTCRQWCAIIDEMADLGCLWLLFTGGECLLRQDFAAIWQHAKKRGLLLTLFTNGTGVTDEIAAFLADWPPWSVEVSLYGATPATTARVTRTTTAHQQCRQGISRLLQHGIRPILKTMVLRQNAQELPLLRAWAAELGLPFRFDAQPHARPAGRRDVNHVRLTPDQISTLDRNDPLRWRAWQDCAGRIEAPRADDPLFPCSAGTTSFHITPDGSLLPCGMVPIFGCDLIRYGFDHCWHHELPRFLAASTPDSRCRSCALLDLCNHCPGWAYTETHTLTQPVDFLCRITHDRARLLAISP